MSDIPKSKRAHSNLEAHHQALAVRRMISVELLSSFAYSEKKLEAAIKKQTAHIQDPEHKKDVAEAIRSLENDYACWFIKRHRDRVDDLACAIAQHIRAAKTMLCRRFEDMETLPLIKIPRRRVPPFWAETYLRGIDNG